MTVPAVLKEAKETMEPVVLKEAKETMVLAVLKAITVPAESKGKKVHAVSSVPAV